MRDFAVGLLITALFLLHGNTWAEDYPGRIVGVIDGDTVDLLTDAKTLIRVRLSGIDAPERKQSYGMVSKKALSDLAFDRQVVIVGSKVDRYGRLIGKVMVSGVDANLQMVRLGLAWHYKKYEKEQAFGDRHRYAEAELEARAKRVGLWGDKGPIPPWEFRHSKKGLQGSVAAQVLLISKAPIAQKSYAELACISFRQCTNPLPEHSAYR